MKYFYSIVAIIFFVLGTLTYGSVSSYHFVMGASLFIGSGLSFGLAMREDTKEYEKKLADDVNKKK